MAIVAPRATRSDPSPPSSYCASQVLGDAKLCAQWREECAVMANRIIDMRAALKEAMVKVWACPYIDYQCVRRATEHQ